MSGEVEVSECADGGPAPDDASADVRPLQAVSAPVPAAAAGVSPPFPAPVPAAVAAGVPGRVVLGRGPRLSRAPRTFLLHGGGGGGTEAYL